jgi:hypothetical protein
METRKEAAEITTLKDTAGYTRFVWSNVLKSSSSELSARMEEPGRDTL